MKKNFKICMMILFLIILTGCKEIVTDLNGNSKNEFGVNETAVYKNIYYKVTDVEYTDVQDNGTKIEETNKTYIALTFQVENKSKKEIAIPSCILSAKKTSSEQETISWDGDINKKNISVGETYTTTYYMKIDKVDSGKYYSCNEGFKFDLTK